jgi:hypothetical protein
MPTVEDIVELAKDVELGDSIDWSNLKVDRDRVYQIMASQILEMYQSFDQEVGDMKDTMMLSIITKLVVENFVLNLRVESANFG